MLKLSLYTLLLSLAGFAFMPLQTARKTGTIHAVLMDKNTYEVIPFANIVLYKDTKQVAIATTNIDGECFFKDLEPGKYIVRGVYVGYQAVEIKNIPVVEEKTTYVTLPLATGISIRLDVTEIVEYVPRLIDPSTKTPNTITRDQYEDIRTKEPVRCFPHE